MLFFSYGDVYMLVNESCSKCNQIETKVKKFTRNLRTMDEFPVNFYTI